MYSGLSKTYFFKSIYSENLLTDPQCFLDLLQFYDGLCSWEEDSATPVLHEGWVKPMVKSFMSYGFSIRSKLGLTIPSGGNGFNTLSEHIYGSLSIPNKLLLHFTFSLIKYYISGYTKQKVLIEPLTIW